MHAVKLIGMVLDYNYAGNFRQGTIHKMVSPSRFVVVDQDGPHTVRLANTQDLADLLPDGYATISFIGPDLTLQNVRKITGHKLLTTQGNAYRWIKDSVVKIGWRVSVGEFNVLATSASGVYGASGNPGVGNRLTGLTTLLDPPQAEAYAVLTTYRGEQGPRVRFTGNQIPALVPNDSANTTVEVWSSATGGTLLTTSQEFFCINTAPSFHVSSSLLPGQQRQISISFDLTASAYGPWPDDTLVVVNYAGALVTIDPPNFQIVDASAITSNGGNVVFTITGQAVGTGTLTVAAHSPAGDLINETGPTTYEFIPLA